MTVRAVSGRQAQPRFTMVVRQTPYSSWDLRLVLAAVPMRFSAGRRLAALMPILAAACCWFAVPSWASTWPMVVPAVGGCRPPEPVISLIGPVAIAPGQAATFVAITSRGDHIGTGPETLSVTVPAGFRFSAPPPGATLTHGVLALPLAASDRGSVQIVVVAPTTVMAAAAVSTSLTVNIPPDGQCPRRQSTSSSVLTTQVAAATPKSNPGPVSVSAFQSAPGRDAAAPVAGVNTGVMRTGTVGFCLMLSGAIMITGIRRNPHAEALSGAEPPEGLATPRHRRPESKYGHAGNQRTSKMASISSTAPPGRSLTPTALRA